MNERLAKEPKQHGKIRVLYIEDNPVDAEWAQSALDQDEGKRFECEVSETLSQGLERILRGDIDIVLLDLKLPDGEGFEVFERVFLAAPRIPIILLTGVVEDEKIAHQAIEKGAQDYLRKGEIDSRALIHSIHYAIERQRNREELARVNEKLMAANKRLEELVLIDPLTGLLNRRGLERALFRETALMKRGAPDLLMLSVDLDDFKKINDQFGHAAGDVILKEVSHKIQATIRPTDYASRIGGDEFIILLTQTQRAEALKVAERVRLAVSRTSLTLPHQEIRVTASEGLTFLSHEMVSVDELIALGDAAVKLSKEQGKNRVSFFQRNSKHPKSKSKDKRTELSDLAKALKKGGQFYSVKQPIVHLESERIIGYEFLSRCSLGGYEAPDVFFQRSLEDNLLTEVDLQCFKNCFAQARDLPPRLKKHLNLFPSTIMGMSVEGLLEQYALNGDKSSYCVEISEQQIIGDPWSISEPIKALKKAGILIATDDVGFGKSCLESLVILQPDIIKLDKIWVNGISGDSSRLALLKRLLRTLRTMTFQIIAEGVERKKDAQVLLDLGVKWAQGFLFGRPA